MQFWAKVDRPHAVYRMFDQDGVLLWVGMTGSPIGRIRSHVNGDKHWKAEIATIKVTHYDGWVTAAKAEAEAIKTENPKYNTLRPSQVNTAHVPKLSRGDGVHCPRCGQEKEIRKKSYCDDCTKFDQEERRRAAGWVPRTPTLICPKCGGPKDPGPAYCKPCKKIVNQEYHRERARKKREGNDLLTPHS